MPNDFRFSKAILYTLNIWTIENENLNYALEYPDLLFFWRAGTLYINLNFFSNEYRIKYIDDYLDRYCIDFAATIQEPLGQFLIEYDMPAISLQLEFNYKGENFNMNTLIVPEKRTTSIMRVVK